MNDVNEHNDETREEMRLLMSGYVDGELEPDELARFKSYLESDAELRRELEEMGEFVNAASSLAPEALPDEVWDTFLDDVYNRIERRTGWSVLILGLVCLLAIGLYWFVVAPWGTPTVKFVTALPVVGLLVLFGSVSRQRLFMRKTDRYSRDVKR